MLRRFLILAVVPFGLLLLTLPGLTGAGEEQQKPIPGVGPTGKVMKVNGGFKFTEGPASDREGNLYFSDIPNERIHMVNKDGKLSVFMEKSGRANGLMVNTKGEIVACQMGAGRVVAIDPKTKEVRVVAERYKEKPFNAPNDLVIDKQGGVYFTDPGFGAKPPLPQDKAGVYYVDPEGKVTRLIENLTKPNGVILSPDEKTLYVIPSGQAEMMAYSVEEPGKIGKGRVFCKLQGMGDKPGSGGDGCTIDTKGNLYVTSTIGIQVFNPEGKNLGYITFPEQPANVTFGGADMKTLYVTARTSLYSVGMEATGHVFAVGAK